MERQLMVTSPAFANEGLMPIQYTGYGEDISPELRLSPIDREAKSLAIVMDDIEHPIFSHNHWLIWNIPVMQVIPSSIPRGERVQGLGGAIQGCGLVKNCYHGPKPPFNWSHHYQFRVFALDCLFDLPSSSRKRDLSAAMQGHIIQQGCLIGRYR
jgi:Raf kinase inhibitor-like YbhB/YbcL family protein